MAVITEHARDPEQIKQGLQAWLSNEWVDRTDVRINDLKAFGLGGLSNETLEVALSSTVNGRTQTQSIVVRLPPAGDGVFRDYDLPKECAIQQTLGERGFPVPKPMQCASDTSWLGAPFIVMPLVAGSVPESHPPYNVAGWVKSLSPDGQRTMMEGFTDTLAELHRFSPDEHDAALLRRPLGVGLAAELAWWTDYSVWASSACEIEHRNVLEQTLVWCEKYLPQDEPPLSVAWGDARIGNVVFAPDLTVAAVLDWEMACLAPAELDLGWHLAHRRNLADAVGGDLPELPGFPTVQAQLTRYEEMLGRRVGPLAWYEVFGAARAGICRMAIQRAAQRSGQSAPTTSPIRSWALRQMSEWN